MVLVHSLSDLQPRKQVVNHGYYQICNNKGRDLPFPASPVPPSTCHPRKQQPKNLPAQDGRGPV
ncbi:hypothetical protein B0O80DRAFT_476601, partial [Mortierella sp. GBAus27b]